MNAFAALPTRAVPRPVVALQQPLWQRLPSPSSAAASAAGSRAAGVAGVASRGANLLAVVAAAACALARRGGRSSCRGATSLAAAAEGADAGAAPKAKARPRPKAKAKAKAMKRPPPPLAEQAGEGLFAPIVLAGHAIVGEPFVVKARGKGIFLHTKVITAFCEAFAVPNRKRQGFIKTAKTTGHDLGMLVPGGHFGDGLLGEQAMQWWKDVGADQW
uniref:Uncharacterized protein n=1 Tax=Alexandrium andersonii TaxID=327968 RepID=A0A7S2F1A3_9DINO|mmetsp:Transcript_11716/g.26612  ORF Transcript_11716/g.26612 Transcript_11716/m.26612 type:complete len:217 (+) Transcript_11716:49-699(+)